MMGPEQMRALGLTKSPDETGVIHDCYFRNAEGPLYLTAAEWSADGE